MWSTTVHIDVRIKMFYEIFARLFRTVILYLKPEAILFVCRFVENCTKQNQEKIMRHLQNTDGTIFMAHSLLFEFDLNEYYGDTLTNDESMKSIISNV